MSSTWASVVPAGTGTQDTTPTTSTASLPVLARRFLADPHEIGRIEGIGPDLWKLGAASTRASVGREPVTAEDCGSDCGGGVSNWARTPTVVLVHPTPPQAGFGATSTFGSRADPRERGPPCAGGHGRLAEAGACSQADQDGRPFGAALTAIDLSVVRGVGSSTVVRGSVGSYRPVIAGAKLREGTTTILPRGRALQGVGLSSMRFHPTGGGPEDDKDGQEAWFTARNASLLDRPEIDWPCRT